MLTRGSKMDERTETLFHTIRALRNILANFRGYPGIDVNAAQDQLREWEKIAKNYAYAENEDYWEPLWPGKPIVNTEKSSCTVETWCNDKCQVFVYDWPNPDRGVAGPEGWPKIINLSMKLNNREPWHDWRDFQRIKNEICGTACWAFEVYPAQDSLVDTANQYHMFVTAPGYRFPVNLEQDAMVDYSIEWQHVLQSAANERGEEWVRKALSRAKQREWSEHHKCDDLPLVGPAWRKRGYRVDDEGTIFGPEGRVK